MTTKKMLSKKGNKRPQQQWALISGASSGIGEATAYELAAQGYSLVLLARRKERLTQIQKDLQNRFAGLAVELIVADVQDAKKLKDCFAKIQTKLKGRLAILVNNAGLAKGTEKIQDGHTHDWDVMLDTNVKGLLYLTRLCVPLFVAQSGTIVNLGSVAGRWLYVGGAVYCATKFAVRALSEGFRMDLAGTGIRVCNIEPGMVETEFSLVRFKDADKAKAVYAGMTPLTAKDIAESIAWMVSRPKHVNIQELVIFPTDQAAVGQVVRK